MSTMSTYDVAEHTILNNGGTFMCEYGTIIHVNPDSILHADFAWVVAVPPDMNANGMAKNRVYKLRANWNAKDVQKAVWNWIRYYHDGSKSFGTWIDNGYLYIDHVIFTSKTDAIGRAIDFEEKAIYNLLTKETVTL